MERLLIQISNCVRLLVNIKDPQCSIVLSTNNLLMSNLRYTLLRKLPLASRWKGQFSGASSFLLTLMRVEYKRGANLLVTLQWNHVVPTDPLSKMLRFASGRAGQKIFFWIFRPSLFPAVEEPRTLSIPIYHPNKVQEQLLLGQIHWIHH